MKKERGICILCGEEKSGTPAGRDIVISLARKIRSALKMKEKHTIACGECLAECGKKRQRFEKMIWNYRIYAALFFLLLLGGAFAMGNFTLWLVLPGLLGAAFISLLPAFHYFPKFSF